MCAHGLPGKVRPGACCSGTFPRVVTCARKEQGQSACCAWGRHPGFLGQVTGTC